MCFYSSFQGAFSVVPWTCGAHLLGGTCLSSDQAYRPPSYLRASPPKLLATPDFEEALPHPRVFPRLTLEEEKQRWMRRACLAEVHSSLYSEGLRRACPSPWLHLLMPHSGKWLQRSVPPTRWLQEENKYICILLAIIIITSFHRQNEPLYFWPIMRKFPVLSVVNYSPKLMNSIKLNELVSPRKTPRSVWIAEIYILTLCKEGNCLKSPLEGNVSTCQPKYKK